MATSSTRPARRPPTWLNLGQRPTNAPPEDPNETELAATLEGSTPRFVSPDGTFAIWSAVRDDGTYFTLQGPLARCAGGEMLSCRGKWRNHPRHGWSFAVDAYESALPQSREGIKAWLQARVPGIGPVFAQAIADAYGERAFEVIDADPSVLYDLRTKRGTKISAKQVDALIGAWGEIRTLRQIETWLFGAGITAKLAARLYQRYGDNVIAVLEENPYQISEIPRVGFKIADKIALKLGMSRDDPRRIRAGLRFVLEEAESDGHSFLTLEQLFLRAAATPRGGKDDGGTLAVGDRVLVAKVATEMAAAGEIVAEDDPTVQQRVYRRHTYEMERRLARRVRDLCAPAPLVATLVRPEIPEGVTADEARSQHIYVPTEEQWSAVEKCVENRLTLLTGGPGVGKCIGPDTPVLVNGDLRSAEALWDSYRSDETRWDGEGEWSTPKRVLTTAALSEAGRMGPARITQLYRQRVKERLRRVTLEDGSEVVMTQAHRVLGVHGWTNEVAVGDRVGVPDRLPSTARGTLDDALARLLAWQIAEGHEGQRTRRGGPMTVARITQKDEAVLHRVREAARRFEAHSGVCLNAMSIRPTTSGRAWVLSIASEAYREWLVDRGYSWGRRSATKAIPGFIVSARPSVLRTFLREFFSAEGSVRTDTRAVELSSASRRLMDQISLMLRRLGVWMRIREVRKAATNGSNIKRTYYRGLISGPSLRVFAARVGFSDGAKESRLRAAAAGPSNANLEVVPMRDLFERAAKTTGLSRHQLGVSSSYLGGAKDCGREVASRFRETLTAIADGRAETAWNAKSGNRYSATTAGLYAGIDRDHVAQMAAEVGRRIDEEVRFVRVRSVEEFDYDGFVYDFEVAGPHNYVAGGMLCHNTATQDMLIHSLKKASLRVALCAPTGKAARRMTELTGEVATTVHRLLEWSPIEGGFTRDESNPIEADVVICDEASMLSLDLADALIAAIGPQTHLLLVGDPDQLPPVGVGKFLSDLIDSERVARVHLTTIFRQAAGSMIIANAHRINSGRTPFLNHAEAQEDLGREMLKDMFWIGRQSPEESAALAVEFAVTRIPRTYGLDPVRDIMVLAPMHSGACGLDVLNGKLQEALNPHGKPIGVKNIRRGDRIVQNRNDYTPGRETVNGQLGVVDGYDPETTEATIELDDERRVLIPAADMETWSLAWAMTVHKSQGSQWPAVVTPVSKAHYVMLSRALTYTAVTRAQKVVVMVGERAALEMAVKNNDSGKRNSTLPVRINDPELSGELF